ncbi:hypothetical protein L7F22_060823 [Adiantum nelumboides]|nr:hypothetical protein [Adiantum nelumboides]
MQPVRPHGLGPLSEVLRQGVLGRKVWLRTSARIFFQDGAMGTTCERARNNAPFRLGGAHDALWRAMRASSLDLRGAGQFPMEFAGCLGDGTRCYAGCSVGKARQILKKGHWMGSEGKKCSGCGLRFVSLCYCFFLFDWRRNKGTLCVMGLEVLVFDVRFFYWGWKVSWDYVIFHSRLWGSLWQEGPQVAPVMESCDVCIVGLGIHVKPHYRCYDILLYGFGEPYKTPLGRW